MIATSDPVRLTYTVIGIFIGLGVVLTGIAYFVGTWRTGRVHGRTDAVEAANSETDIYRKKTDRLETDLHEAQREISSLQAQVHEIKEQNAELKEENLTYRELLMGKEVQPALLDAMRLVAKEAQNEILATLVPSLVQAFRESVKEANQ